MTVTDTQRPAVTVTRAAPERARDVVAVILEAFSRRPVLAPPAPALLESEESVAEALRDGGGLVADVRGRAVGACLLHERDTARGRSLELRRVSDDYGRKERCEVRLVIEPIGSARFATGGNHDAGHKRLPAP